MWFLLLQIFLLLVLAAACGAALAWWWLQQRYVDVTESHETLQEHSARLDLLDAVATRDDLAAAKDTLAAAVADLRVPDITPMEQRLAQIERMVAGIHIPEPDLGPLSEQLLEIEARLASSLTTSDEGARNLASQLGAVDGGIASVAAALAGMREAHFQPLDDRFELLDLRLAEIQSRFDSARRTDIEAVTSRLANLSAAVAALPAPDIGAVEARLARVEAEIARIIIPEIDLRPTEERLDTLQQAVLALDKPGVDLGPLQRAVAALDKPPVDFGPLHGRLAAIESGLTSAMHPMERRIAGLQEAVQGMPQTDLSPVLDALHLVDSREDLGAVEDRLTAIEYNLAALHHMLRSRGESTGARAERPAPPRRPTPPARPMRDLDPVNAARRVDDRANLLTGAAFGPADDLKQINGVGPILCEMLHDIGVYYFWQVAEWSQEEADWVDSLLAHFRGRIHRDNWIGHARTLATQPGAARRPTGYDGR